MLIKACLNGSRAPGEHPALPLSPVELALDARRAVDAGAGALHFHARDAGGRETLANEAVAAAVAAVRAACPGVPVGVSTSAVIEPDAERRLHMVRGWTARPDFASVNLSEPGAEALCEALFELGIGVEAGVWMPEDVERLLAFELARRCVRVLIELVRERTAKAALGTATEIERLLDAAGVRTSRLLHGEEVVAWPMLAYGIRRGYDIRIGLEDTLVLPDGHPARDNAQLVAVARARAAELATIKTH